MVDLDLEERITRVTSLEDPRLADYRDLREVDLAAQRGAFIAESEVVLRVLLERGPVAIYQTGALLGQGLLDPLPDGATTSIPFAVERAVAVTVTHDTEQTPARLVKIANGRITVEEFSQRSTTFEIQNGTDRSTKLYVRHARMTNWEVVDPEKWVPHGYACVRVDSRGTGMSPGYLDMWSPRETRDIYECIEWAAAQDWCDGKVGMSGISYYAMRLAHLVTWSRSRR